MIRASHLWPRARYCSCRVLGAPKRLTRTETCLRTLTPQLQGRAGGTQWFDAFPWRLTFDMRGGRQTAKLAVGRPLDGRVRPRVHLVKRVFRVVRCGPSMEHQYETINQ